MVRTRNLEESIAIPAGNGHQLHLHRIYANNEGTPVFLLHGLGEDGRVFYSDDGEGIGHQLAYEGYDVYIGDARGHGRSWPAISKDTRYSTHQLVTQDISLFLEEIFRRRGVVVPLVVTHGLGGALFTAFMARNPESLEYIRGVIHFGAYRRATPGGKWKQFQLNWVWGLLAPILIRMKGYLPARLLRMGSADEAAGFFLEALDWLNSPTWTDGTNGFNYSEALAGITLPPSLYLAQKNYSGPGDEQDVRLFMQEIGRHNARLIVIGKKAGGQRNYGKWQLVSSADALAEQLPDINLWLSGLQIAD